MEQHVVDDVDGVPRVQRDTERREKGTERGGEGGEKGASSEEWKKWREKTEAESLQFDNYFKTRILFNVCHPPSLHRSPLELF